jgi:hypothetical protein
MRELTEGLWRQLRTLWRLLLAIYVPVLILLFGAAALSQLIPQLTIPDLIQDLSSLGHLPFYAGALSQLGLLFWSASTTLCFFIYFCLKKMKNPRQEALNFMLFAGLLNGYMMLDDTYMLHDEVFPDYLRFIPEKAAVLALGVAVLAFLYFNRREILRGEYGLMFLALVLFGLSVALDAIPTELYEYLYFLEKVEHLLEDGAKLAAIVTWGVYYARYGVYTLLPREDIAALN